MFINVYHSGRVVHYECVGVVRGGFKQNRVWRDVVEWDRLGRYTQGRCMEVYLP